jgi:cyclophilin family peptidyl-prolyl cis-trans isomerase
MPSRTRQRELARLRARRQSERRRARRRRALLLWGSLSLVLVAALVVGAVALSRPAKKKPAAQASPTTAAAPTTTVVPPPAGSARVDAPTAPATVACGGKLPPRRPHPQFKHAPPASTIAAGKRYQVSFRTSCGSFTVLLDPKSAPLAAANMAFLVEHHFYDSTWFHRIVQSGIYVLQGGDPAGKGTGGPGYTIKDEPPKGSDPYKPYTVAMAKTAAPNSAGSQFFINTRDNSSLPHDYAVFGRVVAGQAVVDRIAKVPLGGPNGDSPQQAVWIERATLMTS